MSADQSVITASMGLLSGYAGLRPPREQLDALAARLTALGFEVLRTGRFAISFRGEASLMKEQFTSAALASQVSLSSEHFKDPTLRAMGGLLEVVPPAILLNKSASPANL